MRGNNMSRGYAKSVLITSTIKKDIFVEVFFDDARGVYILKDFNINNPSKKHTICKIINKSVLFDALALYSRGGV